MYQVDGHWHTTASMHMFNQLQICLNYVCKYVAYTFPICYYMYSITTNNPEIATGSHCIVVRTLSAFCPGVAAWVNPIREGMQCRCIYSYTVHVVLHIQQLCLVKHPYPGNVYTFPENVDTVYHTHIQQQNKVVWYRGSLTHLFYAVLCMGNVVGFNCRKILYL